MVESDPGVPPSEGHALYVYAVCRADGPSPIDGLPGVTSDAPVRTLPFGALTAVVQTVAAADFTDEAWQRKLADVTELERCARAHHEVVSAVAAHAPVVPLPMATLYHGDDSARRALHKESERFDLALRRVARHAEWGVKVYAAPAPQEPEPAEKACAPAGRDRPEPGAGRAYLDRKRNLRARREQRQEDSLRLAETVHAAVASVASASRRLRTHGPGTEPGGSHNVQILNATYLVAEHRAAELALLAQTLRGRTGARIELSGPWVPYSFVGEV